MKSTYYKYPFRDTTVIGPHTSEWIKSKISLDMLSLMGKDPLTFLRRAQPLQTRSCWIWISGRPVTIFLRAGRAL